MATWTVSCACGSKLKVREDMVQQTIRCARCSRPVFIPSKRFLIANQTETKPLIRTLCHCGMTIKGPLEWAGRTGTCPRCGRGVTLPMPRQQRKQQVIVRAEESIDQPVDEAPPTPAAAAAGPESAGQGGASASASVADRQPEAAARASAEHPGAGGAGPSAAAAAESSATPRAGRDVGVDTAASSASPRDRRIRRQARSASPPPPAAVPAAGQALSLNDADGADDVYGTSPLPPSVVQFSEPNLEDDFSFDMDGPDPRQQLPVRKQRTSSLRKMSWQGGWQPAPHRAAVAVEEEEEDDSAWSRGRRAFISITRAHRSASAMVAALFLLGCLGFLGMQLDSASAGPSSESAVHDVYYYDLGSGHLFVASSADIPPIAAPSGPLPGDVPGGVRAYVFACGSCQNPDDVFVGLLQAYTPVARNSRVAFEEGMRAGGMSLELVALNEAAEGGRLIKVPGESDWVKANSPAGIQLLKMSHIYCEDGVQPVQCTP